jgi:hypothetical protein
VQVKDFMPNIAVISMDNYNDGSKVVDSNFDGERHACCQERALCTATWLLPDSEDKDICCTYTHSLTTRVTSPTRRREPMARDPYMGNSMCSSG